MLWSTKCQKKWSNSEVNLYVRPSKSCLKKSKKRKNKLIKPIMQIILLAHFLNLAIKILSNVKIFALDWNFFPSARRQTIWSLSFGLQMQTSVCSKALHWLIWPSAKVSAFSYSLNNNKMKRDNFSAKFNGSDIII